MEPTPTLSSPLLDVVEAAAYLHISERSLRNLTAAGELPVVRIGRRSVRFEKAELDRLIAASRVEGGR